MVIEARAEWIGPANSTWGDVLSRIPHDIYHTAAYYRLDGLGTVGTPCAFVYEEEDQSFLWPYFLTPISEAAGYYDVTSAYGYPGPVSTPNPAFVQRAWRTLLSGWKEQKVVSAFTRFHPLLRNSQLLDGITDAEGNPASAGFRECGSTVSIDLTQSLDQQVRGYNKKLRQGIRKLYESGYECSEDRDFVHIDDFIRVYTETMSRRMSRPEFFVDAAWVHELRATLGSALRLFVTTYQGAVVAAMLVIAHAPFLHCHLVGTAEQFAEASPSKALLDHVRVWGSERGLRSMHLGGGVGGRQDSLFDFKRKFSDLSHPFQIGCWILDETVYRELADAHRAKMASMGLNPGESDFFPAYRKQVSD